MLTDTKVASIKPPATGQEEYPDAKVTGLRLRVGAGGAKTWTLRRRVGGKVINRKIGNYPATSLAGARSAAMAMIKALEASGSTEALDRTFYTVAEYWIDKVAKPKNDSWKDVHRKLELHVYPSWRDRKIAEIKRSDVRELLDGIEGVVLPNRILSAIKTIFRFAMSRDWLEASPVEGIAKPNAEPVRDRVLDMGEIKQVWDACALAGFPFGSFVRTLILTGQRRAEVAGMRWADLDLEVATWIIPAGDTKAERTQLVPLSPMAVAMLEGLPELGEFVFSNDGETHISGYSKGKARLDKFIAANGPALAPWRLHDLRRSTATHLVRLGITETVVSRVLNHAQQGVTARVYALHSYAPEKRHALDTWATEIDRAVNGERGGNVIELRGAQ
jgi:integrase